MRADAGEPPFRYTRFEINNFRCFQTLEISPLSLVNLITGMNGVGKTTVLEAFFLHMGPMNPTLAWRVNMWRGLGSVEEWSGMLWRTLFWQFRTQSPICLVGTDSRGCTRSLTVTIAPSSASLTEDTHVSIGSEFAKDLGHELVLEYQDEKGEITTVRGIPELAKRGDFLHFQLKTDPPVAKAPFPGIFLNSWHKGPGDLEVQRFSDLRIKHQDDVVDDFLEFPKGQALETFDRSDRKFVAVALGSKLNPPILNAVDTDWWEFRAALKNLGILVEFICPEMMGQAARPGPRRTHA